MSGACGGCGKACTWLGDIGRVLLASVLAFAVGMIIRSVMIEGEDKSFDDFMLWLEFPGKMWLNGLKLVVLPMIFANMLTSVATLKTMPGARRLAGMTFGYYLATTLLAALTGFIFTCMIIVPNVVEIPEGNLDTSTVSAGVAKASSLTEMSISQSVQGVFYGIVPANIIAAAAGNNLLGIIFFGLAIGFAIEDAPNSMIFKFFDEGNRVLGKMIIVLVMFTPIGIFSLVTPKIVNLELTVVAQYIGIFLGCVFSALSFHAFITYPLLFFLFTRRNPFPYMRNILPAVLTAMGTSSSAATLPVTLECAKRNGVRDDIAKFVISLGCTINMDGTAIGFPCAAIFLSFAQGLPMNVGQMLVVVFLSTIASMGAAPIPSAGLVLLVTIMESSNIPLNGLFGIILAVDWLYDRPETMVNIIGDSLAAVVMELNTAKAPDPASMTLDKEQEKQEEEQEQEDMGKDKDKEEEEPFAMQEIKAETARINDNRLAMQEIKVEN